ncbi:MauE/DoxX family redox-associated membrane protein [Pedobacter lusitanus]|uniref:MauE/DoxX family redox-associated membrane protein n=1 Tax=Pedobacter lusitanus TaxID=1503925 RepID=UPI0009E394D1|nr:MauE/DoxX family redox-associated membrane protein [Pedobacter lusitanus]
MGLSILIYIITGCLIMLWTYASVSKLFDLTKFRAGLKNQVFPKWIGEILTWGLPVLELGIIYLLVFDETRLLGMYLSFGLMTIFSLYIAGAVFRVYDRYPCPCGGLFRRIGWYRHLKINLLFTLIALAGIVLMELTKN